MARCEECYHYAPCFSGGLSAWHDVEQTAKDHCKHFVPADKVQEVRPGEWVLEREPNGNPYCFHCSVCDDDFHHIGIKTATDYCPNCGAKMDGKDERYEHKKLEVTLTCELVAEGQYYLNGTRLHFDEPWAVYIVNGDMYIPYYRIYINNKFIGVSRYDHEALDFLLKAHNPLATRV